MVDAPAHRLPLEWHEQSSRLAHWLIDHGVERQDRVALYMDSDHCLQWITSYAAIHKAEGKDQPVTQEIAMSVKGDKVECAINGTTVATYDKPALVTAGKLKSTDGVYGIRSGHDTEVMVKGLTVTKN